MLVNTKYLTILSGNPRGGEATWNSLYKNVLEPLNSDLAICTGNKWIINQSFLKVAKFKWIFEEPSNWEQYYESNFDGKWKEYFFKGIDTGLYSSGMIHFALKDIILKNYIEDILNYDVIIFSRFDQFYLTEQKKFDTNYIHIPSGEDYFGICDRHAIVPKKYIIDFLKICEFVNSDQALDYNDNHLNCEVTFKNQLDSFGLLNKVKRFNRTQFTSALNSDFTNWRVPKYKLYFFNKLMIKYPDEFIQSFKNINIFKKINLILNKNIFLYFNYLYIQLRIYLGKLKQTYR